VVENLMPARLAELKRVAPDVEFIPVKTAEDAARSAEDADAVLGFCTADIVKAGKDLRWIQTGHAGVDKDLVPELVASKVVLTNTQRIYGPEVADQVFALLLALTRGLAPGGRGAAREKLKEEVRPKELHGKTLLVVGLGGVGTQVSRRAHAFGMRVRAIDPKEMERPAFVFSLDRPDKLMDLLPEVDVVVLACPLTAETRGLMGGRQFAALKPTAYFINVARGGLVETPALTAALERKQLAGAGLDVTDPEPLPDGHPLWSAPGLLLTPHVGGAVRASRERAYEVVAAQLARLASGQPLLNVITAEGY
jgi:phosphoglycerate dehydrogenase-like enzyme